MKKKMGGNWEKEGIGASNHFFKPPGIPSDWSDLTGYINTLKVCSSCH